MLASDQVICLEGGRSREYQMYLEEGGHRAEGTRRVVHSSGGLAGEEKWDPV